jgi:hypothetical protein
MTLSGIGQYMITFTSKLVEFLGSEFQSSGSCHIIFFISLGLNNYLKVTNVDRYKPREFYHHSNVTNYGPYGQIW